MRDYELQYGRLLTNEFAEEEKREQSFLSIAGMAHYENVNSNLLRFYFDSKEEHGLQDLFLKSLLELIDPNKKLSFIEWTVEREVSTSIKKRIDLVILSADEDAAIIIENKFYHYLNNDLDNYWDRYNKIQDNNKLGVVLSLYGMESPSSRYINITHQQLCQQVLQNLGNYILRANQKHLVYLRDYIENIKTFYMSDTEKRKLQFYFDNVQKINELSRIKQEAEKYIFQQVAALSEPLGLSANFIKQNCCYIFKFPEIKTGSLYYAIFLDNIFSDKSTFEIILEGHGIDLPVQKKVIKNIAQKYPELVHSKEPDTWIHFLKKTYDYHPTQTENFTSILLEIIQNDFEDARAEITKHLLGTTVIEP